MPMMPNCDRAIVAPEKIIDYLLSDTQSVGRHKAGFFTSFGFRADTPDVLANALRRHAAMRTYARMYSTPHGVKYEISGPLPAPDGRMPTVRSIWIIDAGATVPRLVTAFPD